MTRIIVKLHDNTNINIINSNVIKLMKSKNSLYSNYNIKKLYKLDRIYDENTTTKKIVFNELKTIMSKSFLLFFHKTKQNMIFGYNGVLKIFVNFLRYPFDISVFEVNNNKLIDLLNNNKINNIVIKNNITCTYVYKTKKIKNKNDFDKIINKLVYNNNPLHLIVNINYDNKIYSFIILRNKNKSFIALKNCIKSLNSNKKYIPFAKSSFTMILKKLNMKKWNSIFFTNIYNNSNIIHTLNLATFLFNNSINNKEYKFDNLDNKEYKFDNLDNKEYKSDNLDKMSNDKEYKFDNLNNKEYKSDNLDKISNDKEYKSDNLSKLSNTEEPINDYLLNLYDKFILIKNRKIFDHLHILFKHMFIEIVKINNYIEQTYESNNLHEINEELLIKAISLKRYMITTLTEILNI